ncbi:uncharacterized protein BXZ73DRAFT_79349 [Epithele typhae]|uniref:uncharacterized protein n=1 Tax=Epithele typhae TaxID=378194 RepID=UPI0020077C88|nr:uncharacterized protein BXZ73DRAFT_79349 [Epithele typhae]KAH9923949.1 hypothetical protein BXZ73DRAFT_79349 [Epithele typhae]
MEIGELSLPPTATPAPATHGQPSRKRKHAAVANTAAASPAPSDPGATPAPENLVLSARHDLSSRPRLTISRHPGFVPAAPSSEYFTTEPLCFNRLGFRYTPAGIGSLDHALPFRTIESEPARLRVSWEDRSPFVRVTQDGLRLQGEKGFRSARCNAPVREGRWFLEVAVASGAGARPLGPHRNEGAHLRLGWARREAPLNAPAGYDGYSYAVRDRTGEKVTLSRPRPYGRPFGSGDVVGLAICLPPRRRGDRRDPYDPAHVKRERIAIEFKGQEYFESLEYPQSKEMVALMDANDRAKGTDTKSVPSGTKKSATVKNVPSNGRGKGGAGLETTPMRPLPTLGSESYIAFFVNGECQGIAFQDLYDYRPLRTPPNKSAHKKRANKEGIREHKENPFDDGTLGYYPFISLFNGAQVSINPGPDFAFPPPPDIDAVVANPGADIKPAPDSERTWRPMCERYEEFMQEQWELDDQEEAEAIETHPPYSQLMRADAEERRQEKEKEKSEPRQPKRKPPAGSKASRGKHPSSKLHDAGSVPPPAAAASAPKRAKVASASPALGTFPRAGHAASNASVVAPVVVRGATPATREGSERVASPAPTAASSLSLDAQIAGLAGYADENEQDAGIEQEHDQSAYNTDYEDGALNGADTDGDVEFGDVEMDAIEEAVDYSYASRRP